jgi:transposase-like protein
MRVFGFEKPLGKKLEIKKSRYKDEQIAFALKQAETGTPVAEVIRRMGISEQTFYRWRRCTAVRRSRCRRTEALEAARG